MIENYTLINEAKKSHLLSKHIYRQIQLSDIIRKKRLLPSSKYLPLM